MAEKYWIGDFFIDTSRNQITHNKLTQSLPPKALAVLTYLAQHQGQVVSQDALLTHVWQETVVSSNTLQRCIAQLRKAFGDDGKAQGLIKTHAKRGYSLECEVRWQSEYQGNGLTDSHSDTSLADYSGSSPQENPVVKHEQFRWIALPIMALLMMIFSADFYFSQPDAPIAIKNINPLTSTDNRELASIYSPDGNFVVFKRYPEVLCTNNLWAKNLQTQEEFRLTQELGSYESLAFSTDGNTLTFIKEDDCRQPITQKRCYQLQSLNFQQALTAPQVPATLMECNNSTIRTVKWTNDDTVALLQQQDDRWQLILYSISREQSEVIYALEEGSIVSFDYSPQQQRIALISTRSNGEFYIDTLSPSGELITSNPIHYPSEIPKFRRIYPRFSSQENQLIFSTGRQLFLLSFEGEITNISLPLAEAMGTPVFHPSGSKMLAIKGHYDSDIVQVPMSQFPLSNTDSPDKLASTALSYKVLARSIFAEDLALYQPGGNRIAYISKRSGNSQLWINQAEAPQQLSHFPVDTYIYQFLWAKDGESLLVNVSFELKQVDLNGVVTAIDLDYPVDSLYHWNSDTQMAIALIRVDGVLKLAEVNLGNGDIRIITNKAVGWAAKSDNGQILFMDKMHQFWQTGTVETQPIPVLNGQGSNKHFIVKNNTIYGVNDNYQLWSYSLETQRFKIIGDLPDTIDTITDISQQNLLFTLRVAARKEVVELVLE